LTQILCHEKIPKINSCHAIGSFPVLFRKHLVLGFFLLLIPFQEGARTHTHEFCDCSFSK
jgi:hypothetical protein